LTSRKVLDNILNTMAQRARKSKGKKTSTRGTYKQHYNFRTFRFCGVDFPRVLMGTSPFIAASQFGERAYYYRQQFMENPANMRAVVLECIKLGCNAIQLIAYPQVIRAVAEALKKTQVRVFIMATVGLGDVYKEIEMLRPLEPQAAVVHGSYTDRALTSIPRQLRMIKDRLGSPVVGVATHLPGLVVERVALIDEVDVIMMPFNKSGTYMRPSLELSLVGVELARERGKRIVAMKPLAGGALSPQEALPFLVGKVDALAVGMASAIEIRETLDVCRQHFGRKR
jgi:hypothetical protein